MKFKSTVLAVALCLWGVGCVDSEKSSDPQSLKKTLEVNEIKGEVVSTEKLGSGLDMMVVRIDQEEIPFLATSDGKIIFQPSPQAFITQDKETEEKLKTFYEKLQEKEQARIDNALKEMLTKDQNISFKFSAKKETDKTIYIVSDPNCIYCRGEFAKLDERLQEANVEMVLVGFLNEDSIQRVANALKDKSKVEAENRALLEKIYSDGYKPKQVDVTPAFELSTKIMNLGVDRVPYIVE